MFNKKWKKILVWSLSVVIVLAVGGLFAANYAVDRLMSSMAGGLDLESDDTAPVTDQVAIADPTSTPVSTDSAPLETATAEPTPGVVSESAKPAATEEASTSPSEQATPKSTQSIASPTTKPTSTVPPAKDKNLDGYSAQVSTDKAKHIQENVTVKEKADVASIVLGQLSVADIKRLQELASGGLTIEEKREARSIILGKVSDEQYNELSQIAKKYGVSEGKTKDQVIEEEEALQQGSEQ
ncbi:hypothetical protein A3842_04665 [Paenibacillus sp. P3E]|uniref:hypothetical protein n=1 Tax=Paenibacillus sp. P3E TaxID=1349435 RepID=UPI00093EE2EB|nr:hypothetical protein [Paenibacillus sp. P3E]OKP89375.1 hypothetical protein A3842_04665 [Paenibacillus sp. P3E]